MKCSLGKFHFLEEISSLSHSVVFLYFFALTAEEGFLISPCYSLELCIQMGLSFLFSFAFSSSSFLFVKPSQTTVLPFCISFSWGWFWSQSPIQCYKPPSIVLQALFLSYLIPWIYLSLLLYNHKVFNLGYTWIAEKAMATHSSALAWRIPGTGEPDGLPSMGSHRVGHDWRDLTAAYLNSLVVFPTFFNLSLNLAIRSSWSEPQSAPSFFCWLCKASPSFFFLSDCIELLQLWLHMCRVVSCVVGRGCLLWPVHSLGKTLLSYSLLFFILYSKAKLAFHSRYLLTAHFYIPVPYDEKDIFFEC